MRAETISHTLAPCGIAGRSFERDLIRNDNATDNAQLAGGCWLHSAGEPK